MNIALRRPPMSLDEFLAWENRQEERWEFDGFEPRAMVGGTIAHNVIVGNPCSGPATPVGPLSGPLQGVKLRMAQTDPVPGCNGHLLADDEGSDRSDGPRRGLRSAQSQHLPGGSDRENREYAATPSIQRYIILEQDAIAAEVFGATGKAGCARR